MIILNQNETATTEDLSLKIYELDTNNYTIYDKSCAWLGTYDTKERANEILKEIRTAYSNFTYFKNATKEGKNYMINLLKHKYEQFDIYEMPQK